MSWIPNPCKSWVTDWIGAEIMVTHLLIVYRPLLMYKTLAYMCFVAPRERRGDVFHDEWRVPWCVCASLPGPAAWYPSHLYWGARDLAKNGPWTFPEWQMSQVPGMDPAWQGKCTLSLVMSFSHFTTGCQGELHVSHRSHDASAATCKPYLELAVARAAWGKINRS